ncbi:MAG TPA: FtsX-like permease family protein, partial [Abditibacteriaceae bacterium]|nr:FtsX-like permease family protein [Abditibacteriaceae bacterium]
AVSRSLAAKFKLAAGSRLDLFVGAERKQFRVCAVLPEGQLKGAFGGDVAVLDIAAAQEAFSEIGKLSQIDLLVDETQIDAVAAALKRIVPADATVQRPAQRSSQVADMLAAFQLNLSALSCIAIFVGAFLIYNAIASAVVRRRAEVGILRAIGAGGNQLSRMFLIEAAVIGFIGSTAGLLLGIALARFTLQAVSTTVSALYIAVKAREVLVPLWLWWGAPLGGTLLAVLAALPAAWEAAGTSPRAAMVGATLHQTTVRFAWPMAAVGGVLLAGALVLCQPFLSGRTPLAGFAAAFCTLGGFSLLTPAFTLTGSTAIQRVMSAVAGVEGSLAAAYLRRALNRSSLVIAALMVSLAMTIGLSVMIGSFRNTVATWVTHSVTADVFVAPATGFSGDLGPGLPHEVVRYTKQLPGLRLWDSLRGAELVIGQQPVFIAANIRPGVVVGAGDAQFLETAHGATAARRAYLAGQAILISERFKNLLGYRSGDTITLTTPSGPVRFFIEGVFYDYTPNQCVLYMPQSLYRRYWKDPGTDGMALYLQPGVEAASVKQALDRHFGGKYALSVSLNSELRAEVFKTFDQTFAVTYALQLIALIVAVVGIFDTLTALLLERGREIATLRAMGAARSQISKITFIEFGLIGCFGWVVGVAAGLCLAWELIYVINRQFFGWSIQWSLPPGVLWQSLALALIAAVGAGVLPAWAAARRNIAEALQME